MNSFRLGSLAVLILLSINKYETRIVVSDSIQREEYAEVYSKIELTCNLAGNVNWRKLNSVRFHLHLRYIIDFLDCLIETNLKEIKRKC